MQANILPLRYYKTLQNRPTQTMASTKRIMPLLQNVISQRSRKTEKILLKIFLKKQQQIILIISLQQYIHKKYKMKY